MNHPIKINIKKLVPEASIPKNATPLDTGYDLVAIADGEIVGEPINEKSNYWKRIDYIQYRTGIQIAPERKHDGIVGADGSVWNIERTWYYYTLLFPRSSISKYNLILANSVGLVDNPYRGEIILRFKYIWQPEDWVYDGVHLMFASPNLSKIYKKGDKIGQIAAFELKPIWFNETETLDETARGTGGFGSTGT